MVVFILFFGCKTRSRSAQLADLGCKAGNVEDCYSKRFFP